MPVVASWVDRKGRNDQGRRHYRKHWRIERAGNLEVLPPCGQRSKLRIFEEDKNVIEVAKQEYAWSVTRASRWPRFHSG